VAPTQGHRLKIAFFDFDITDNLGNLLIYLTTENTEFTEKKI
jgi:hypothetical protein